MTQEENNLHSFVSITASPTCMRKLKLPTIEFKKFEGDIRDWLYSYIRESLKVILCNAMSNNKVKISTVYDKLKKRYYKLSKHLLPIIIITLLFPLIESCLPEDLL